MLIYNDVGYFSRWEDNINMDLQEVGFGGTDLIGLAQDRERGGDLFVRE